MFSKERLYLQYINEPQNRKGTQEHTFQTELLSCRKGGGEGSVPKDENRDTRRTTKNPRFRRTKQHNITSESTGSESVQLNVSTSQSKQSNSEQRGDTVNIFDTRKPPSLITGRIKEYNSQENDYKNASRQCNNVNTLNRSSNKSLTYKPPNFQHNLNESRHQLERDPNLTLSSDSYEQSIQLMSIGELETSVETERSDDEMRNNDRTNAVGNTSGEKGVSYMLDPSDKREPGILLTPPHDGTDGSRQSLVNHYDGMDYGAEMLTEKGRLYKVILGQQNVSGNTAQNVSLERVAEGKLYKLQPHENLNSSYDSEYSESEFGTYSQTMTQTSKAKTRSSTVNEKSHRRNGKKDSYSRTSDSKSQTKSKRNSVRPKSMKESLFNSVMALTIYFIIYLLFQSCNFFFTSLVQRKYKCQQEFPSLW